MRRVLTVVALAALAAGCASPGREDRSDAAAGRRFAERACAGCHAVERRGESPNPHSPPFRTLAARLPGAALEAQLDGIARQGHVEMPPVYMTPDEIHDVAAYIRAVAGRGA